jgi:hypothetical protein
MTTINNMLMKFPEGIFAGKEPRITNEYVSVYDIIKVAGNQKNPRMVWERIIETYGEEVVSFCDNLKFPGPGQRETPCVNAKGLVKLLMLIPGKLAQEFRNQTADIMLRYLGGDTSLINEIKHTDQLHIQNGESNIFRKFVRKKLNYDEKYYIYVRVYSQFFADQQKEVKEDEKVRKLSWDIIKFGIAKYLDSRENSYLNDNGYFQFTIEVPSKECALFIEKLSRQEYKDKHITVDNTFEYLDSKKLAKNFDIIKNTSGPLEKRDYYLTAKKLYTKMLIDLHMYYPECKDNFGIMNYPKAEQDSDFNTIITNSVSELTKEKLQDYILKECVFEGDTRVEKEIKEGNTDLIEVKLDQEMIIEKLNDELRLEKRKTINVLNLIKKESPIIYEKFITDNNKSEEHHKVWAKNKIFQYTIDGKFIKKFDSLSAVAKFNECSPKAIRNRLVDKRCFNKFLWRSSNDVNDKSDLVIKKIDQCDPINFHIIKTFNNFEEITEFDKYKVNEAIDYGLIYDNFRWKFDGEDIKLRQLIGKTGTNKRLAKMNDQGETLEIYPSLKLASEKNKVSKSLLSQSISKNKDCCGFKWQYVI